MDLAWENRRNGRKAIRHPYEGKALYPLVWPAQAIGLEEKHMVLPMGRGRPSLVFYRPEWLIGAIATGQGAKLAAPGVRLRRSRGYRRRAE